MPAALRLALATALLAGLAPASGLRRVVVPAAYDTANELLPNATTVYILEFPERPSSSWPVRVQLEAMWATRQFPVTAVAHHEGGTTSWQVPFATSAGQARLYYMTGRTLCPTRERAAMRIVVSTTSPGPQRVLVRTNQVRDFEVAAGTQRHVEILPSTPRYFRFGDMDRYKNVLLSVDARDDASACMLVSVQDVQCPVFDLERDVRSEGLFQTVRGRGGLSVRRQDFPHGFFVVFVLLETDAQCSSAALDDDHVSLRRKRFTFRIDEGAVYSDVIAAAAGTLGLLGAFALAWLGVSVAFMRRTNPDAPPPLDGRQENAVRDASRLSAAYSWQVTVVALFYGLPVIQLVLNYLRSLRASGDGDICYYNYLCAAPLGILMDFNHVFSNLGYVTFGLLFIGITYARERNQRSCLDGRYGLPQPFGLYYALGIALIMEGVLSASYHVCPRDTIFQFDTSFMYVIAVLWIEKLYQTRSGKQEVRLHWVFGILALAALLAMIGLVADSLAFRICFALMHTALASYIAWQWDKCGSCRPTPFCGRGRGRVAMARSGFLVLGLVTNMALALAGIFALLGDFATHLLATLIVNTLLYTAYYVTMKVCHGEAIYWYTWLLGGLAGVCWGCALTFFMSKRTEWSVSPAESRSFNAPCDLVRFYDSHDIWHLLSAAALFFSLQMLLTLDDGLGKVAIQNIPDFGGAARPAPAGEAAQENEDEECGLAPALRRN